MLSNTLTGRFALSIAGRDKNRVFIITEELDEGYVYIADGKLRSVDKPKRKKLKHMMLLNTEKAELPLTNKELRNAINALSQA